MCFCLSPKWTERSAAYKFIWRVSSSLPFGLFCRCTYERIEREREREYESRRCCPLHILLLPPKCLTYHKNRRNVMSIPPVLFALKSIRGPLVPTANMKIYTINLTRRGEARRGETLDLILTAHSARGLRERIIIIHLLRKRLCALCAVAIWHNIYKILAPPTSHGCAII